MNGDVLLMVKCKGSMQQTVSQNPDLIVLPASQWTGMIFLNSFHGLPKKSLYNKLKKGVLFKEPPVLNHQAGNSQKQASNQYARSTHCIPTTL